MTDHNRKFNKFLQIRYAITLYKKITHQQLYEMYFKLFGEPSIIQSKEEVFLDMIGRILGLGDLKQFTKLPDKPVEDIFQLLWAELLRE